MLPPALLEGERQTCVIWYELFPQPTYVVADLATTTAQQTRSVPEVSPQNSQFSQLPTATDTLSRDPAVRVASNLTDFA